MAIQLQWKEILWSYFKPILNKYNPQGKKSLGILSFSDIAISLHCKNAKKKGGESSMSKTSIPLRSPTYVLYQICASCQINIFS